MLRAAVFRNPRSRPGLLPPARERLLLGPIAPVGLFGTGSLLLPTPAIHRHVRKDRLAQSSAAIAHESDHWQRYSIVRPSPTSLQCWSLPGSEARSSGFAPLLIPARKGYSAAVGKWKGPVALVE